MLSNGKIRITAIHVPAQSSRAIMNRLHTLRQQYFIEELLPSNFNATKIIHANPELAEVIRIANNCNAQVDFIQQMSTIQTHANYDHSSNSSSEKQHQLNARDLDGSTDDTTESNSISREKLYDDAAENLALEVNRCTASYFSKSYSRSEDQCRAFDFSLRNKYESELNALQCKTPYVNRVSKLVRFRTDSIEKCQWTSDDNANLRQSIAPHRVHDQTNTRAPRPALLSIFALPDPRLSYDEWTVLQRRQHGPLPSGILYHCDGERAKIAPTWDIDILGSMIHLFHGNTNQPILNIPYAHTTENVKRHTTVDMLLKAVRANLLYHCQHARCDALIQKDNIDRAISVLLDCQPLQLAMQEQSGLIIPFEYTAATTVEEIWEDSGFWIENLLPPLLSNEAKVSQVLSLAIGNLILLIFLLRLCLQYVCTYFFRIFQRKKKYV